MSAPTARPIDPAALRAEALHLEATGGVWKAPHVCAILSVCRATVYDTPFLFHRRLKRGRRGVAWDPKDVRFYQALNRTAVPSSKSTTTPVAPRAANGRG